MWQLCLRRPLCYTTSDYNHAALQYLWASCLKLWVLKVVMSKPDQAPAHTWITKQGPQIQMLIEMVCACLLLLLCILVLHNEHTKKGRKKTSVKDVAVSMLKELSLNINAKCSSQLRCFFFLLSTYWTCLKCFNVLSLHLCMYLCINLLILFDLMVVTPAHSSVYLYSVW